MIEEKQEIKGIDKKQMEEINKKNIENIKRAYIDGLLRLYQGAMSCESNANVTLGKNTKAKVVYEMSQMIKIVKRDDWDGVHPHDAFPDIDIRMLAYECPSSIDCPFVQAILTHIGMSYKDYIDYKQRLGNIIVVEHQRKLGRIK